MKQFNEPSLPTSARTPCWQGVGKPYAISGNVLRLTKDHSQLVLLVGRLDISWDLTTTSVLGSTENRARDVRRRDSPMHNSRVSVEDHVGDVRFMHETAVHRPLYKAAKP